MRSDQRPVVAITIGDPAGIGPEVVVISSFQYSTILYVSPSSHQQSVTVRTATKFIDNLDPCTWWRKPPTH